MDVSARDSGFRLPWFEGWMLLSLPRDLWTANGEFMIALLVNLIAAGLLFGNVIRLLAGPALFELTRAGKLKLGHE